MAATFAVGDRVELVNDKFSHYSCCRLPVKGGIYEVTGMGVDDDGDAAFIVLKDFVGSWSVERFTLVAVAADTECSCSGYQLLFGECVCTAR